MPDQLNFTGDFTTILGFIGIVSSAIILITAFRRFFNSPYNIRVKNQQISIETEEILVGQDKNSDLLFENSLKN
jgi:hypothetical protein